MFLNIVSKKKHVEKRRFITSNEHPSFKKHEVGNDPFETHLPGALNPCFFRGILIQRLWQRHIFSPTAQRAKNSTGKETSGKKIWTFQSENLAESSLWTHNSVQFFRMSWLQLLTTNNHIALGGDLGDHLVKVFLFWKVSKKEITISADLLTVSLKLLADL